MSATTIVRYTHVLHPKLDPFVAMGCGALAYFWSERDLKISKEERLISLIRNHATRRLCSLKESREPLSLMESVLLKVYGVIAV